MERRKATFKQPACRRRRRRHRHYHRQQQQFSSEASHCRLPSCGRCDDVRRHLVVGVDRFPVPRVSHGRRSAVLPSGDRFAVVGTVVDVFVFVIVIAIFAVSLVWQVCRTQLHAHRLMTEWVVYT